MKRIIITICLILLLIGCKNSSSPTSPATPDTSSSATQRPRMVSFTGPTSCKLGQTYIYKVKGYDPDGEQVAFHFNLYIGDNRTPTDLGWGPFVDNYTVYEKAVTWNYGTGSFMLCAHCKDKDGYQTLQQGHMTLNINVTE
jgi:hypothetical protein